MFAQTWRSHWGLTQDPFDCEDADKDLILARLDTGAVHAGFDRLFGNPDVPSPGVVFGEKGSGKSGLRLMMRRRIEAHNREREEAADGGEVSGRVFLVEYTEFDTYFEHFRRSVGGSHKAAKVLARWRLADHVDAILSLAVTQLVDQAIDARRVPSALTRKERIDLQLLTGLYYQSKQRTRKEAVHKLHSLAGPASLRGAGLGFLRILGTAAAIGAAVAPRFASDLPGSSDLWLKGGIALLALVWGWTLVSSALLRAHARHAIRNVRVLPPDSDPLRGTLRQLAPGLRREFPLPDDRDDGIRYDLLDRVQGLLRSFGYGALYVLVDRVDEPSFLGADAAAMRAFCEPLLDHKLLQLPGLALKLFLPIELDSIHRNAAPEELKRMRLDKSNLVPELKWSGLELYDIANRRLAASCREGEPPHELADFLAPDLDPAHVRNALDRLATPRYTFGFLSALLQDYIRSLPDDMAAESEAWRLPRAHFDLVSSVWIDRAHLLRRTLN